MMWVIDLHWSGGRAGQVRKVDGHHVHIRWNTGHTTRHSLRRIPNVETARTTRSMVKGANLGALYDYASALNRRDVCDAVQQLGAPRCR